MPETNGAGSGIAEFQVTTEDGAAVIVMGHVQYAAPLVADGNVTQEDVAGAVGQHQLTVAAYFQLHVATTLSKGVPTRPGIAGVAGFLEYN